MRKLISIFLVLLIVIITIGCSADKAATQKTEEELKAEIKAEMEKEAELKEKLRAEVEAEMKDKTETSVPNVSVKDTDAVFNFISDTYPGMYIREDYDKWTPYYFDITNDGNDEVVFTTTYWDGKLENTIFITGDDGEYKVIPSEIGLAKYENTVSYEDGFILISQKSGGSGAFVTDLGIYVYDEGKIRYTDTSIVTSEVVANPTGYSLTGKIEGDMKEFTYTATKEDVASGDKSIEEVTKYVYDEKSMTYTTESIKGDKKANASQPTVIDVNLSVSDFVKEYTPLNIETQDDGGYFLYSTLLTYDGGLQVYIYHDDEDYKSGSLSGITITDKNYRISGLDVEAGMSLQDAYDYCDANFENIYNHHQDIYMDQMYSYNKFCLTLNNRAFGENPPIQADDVVEEIELYVLLD